MPRTSFRWLMILCLGANLLLALPAHADGPNYDLPAHFALPWAYGQAYLVTWTPDSHWSAHKATGIAYDFGLPEGTPLYAPAAGEAHFYQDVRPLEATLGNYIDLVVDDEWLIRLAHLRDPQEGVRSVAAGELLGYSGSSGADAAHLHLELYVREGDRWVCPDMSLLTAFFGVPLTDLAEGALVANTNEAYTVTLACLPAVTPTAVPLGQQVQLQLLLQNEGDQLQAVTVQVTWVGPDGSASVVQSDAGQELLAATSTLLTIPFTPHEAGQWQVSEVLVLAEEDAWRLPTSVSLMVASPDTTVVGVSIAPSVQIGDYASLDVWLENPADDDVWFDGLSVAGVRPDGSTWSAEHTGEIRLPRGAITRVAMRTAGVCQQVGEWTVKQVDYHLDSQDLTLARVDAAFTVEGPELVLKVVDVQTTGNQVWVAAEVSNIGTQAIRPEALELWGTLPDTETQYAARTLEFPELAPGSSTEVRLRVPKGYRLVMGGYWHDDHYFVLTLPNESLTTVG